MKKAYLTLILALAILSSCAETFSPSIKITPSLSEVPYTGGSVDIKVMTDLPWKVDAGEDSPAVISKTAGIGDDVITVTIPETDNWTTSCVTVKFVARSNSSTATKKAYITQGYKPYVNVSGESNTIDRAGGNASIVVTANTDWTASCDTPGVIFSPASGSVGNTAVNISFPANTGTSSRKITVNITADGDSDHFYFVQY
ncbi:MAG: BACON domain-containing protein [Bacteroidales bacterium]|nr:BACON domain-containing protein [Bacteroidales bacterium]